MVATALEVMKNYANYSGSGVMPLLFFASLFFVALTEKDKVVRGTMLYGSVALIAINFFVPLYYVYSRLIDASTYWRLWWTVPIGCGLAYAAANVIGEHKKVGLLLALLVMILGGDFLYTKKNVNGEIRPAENIYQIPQQVMDIVDAIKLSGEGTHIKAAFPGEMLVYIPQYDGDIEMPYGREMLDPNWHNGVSGFYMLMNDDVVNFQELKPKCVQNDTRFIVVNAHKLKVDEPEDWDFELLYSFEDYQVYEQKEIYNIQEEYRWRE